MDYKLTNVSFGYPNQPLLCSNLTMSIPQGSTLIISGPSGAGKTTFLRLLTGQLSPMEGTIEGVTLPIGMVFQDLRLCSNLSVMVNIRLGMAKSPKTATRLLIQSHLEAVGLEGSAHTDIHRLSGGMQQRVAIVRSILSPSQVLLMDEPFRGLDADTKLQVMTYVKQNQNGRTLILVTHQEDEIDFWNAKRLNFPL